MASRYWVGGTGTWTGTTNWSAASALTFTASCVGTALTTTGSPALVAGMTVWSNNNTSLGTIVSGAGNAWVVTVGGTYTSQGMTAATTGATAPTTADDVIFDANSSLVSYTVTTGASPSCQNLTMSGPATGIFTFAGTNNLQFTGAGSHTLRISTPSTVNWTNTGNPQFTSGSANTITLDTNGCPISATSMTLGANATSVTLLSDFTAVSTSITFSSSSFVMNSKIFTCNSISFAGATTPNIAFGTGKIVTYDAFTGVTGMTVTGTPVLELASSGSTGFTINSVANSLNAAISVKTTGGGTYALTIGGGCVLNLDLTGHAGTLAGQTLSYTIYGNLTLSSNPNFSVVAGTGTITFGATSGSKTITTNSKNLDRNLNFNGAGGTWVLQDALTLPTASRALTQTAGTLDMNGKTLTIGTYATAAGTKNLTFNGGSMIVTNSGAVAFNNAVPTGYTTTAGAGGIGTITLSATAAKTFVGGGSTFAASLVQAGAGALTITGSNTFSGYLKNTVQPCTISLTSGTTNTFNGDIKLKGTGGNLVTLNAVTSGSAATLSHTGSNVACDYISVKDNTAAGTVPFYAGAHSTLVSNTTNWLNRPPLSANTEFLTFLR